MRIKDSVKKSMFLLFAVILFVSFAGCSKMREKEYYSDINNFITEEAIVDNIIYNEERQYIVLWLSEIDEEYQTTDFIIEGKNLELVLQNGILDKIKIGDEITYTSATKFFGNGDFMPIISISVSGEELLNMSDGHKNLMDLYN